MRDIKNLWFILLLIIPLNAKAQSTSDKEASENNIVCDTNSFKDNLYIETNLGSQLLFSKDAGNLTVKQRFTPSFSVTGGKWFSPFWGLRLQMQGYSLNGFSTVDGLYIADPVSGTIYGNDDPVRDEVTIRPDGSYRHFIHYLNMHADFQFSLLNLFRSYNDQRQLDIIPSLGLGYMQVMEYKGIPKAGIISTNFGLMGKYHLNKKLDINIELASTIMPDQFDGRIAGNKYEAYCSAGVGITYYFRNRGFKKATPAQTAGSLPPVVKEIVIRDTVFISKPAIESETIKAPAATTTPEPPVRTFNLSIIQFRSESANPAHGQDLSIRNIAGFLEQNPTAKICLEGYADNKTGSESYNLDLAGRRAKAIFDLLTKKYNADPNRLEIKVIGDSNQPFEKSSWNRVVIAVAKEE